MTGNLTCGNIQTMEGVSIPVNKNVGINSGNMRSATNFFRPMFVKRSVTDLVSLPRKGRVKNESESTRQTSRVGNHVPVVSVQYDVPKTPPSPLMYRIRRLNTPQSNFMTARSKTEERISKYIRLEGPFQNSHLTVRLFQPCILCSPISFQPIK